MNEIGAYEAKVHFSDLLQRVKRGERFYITRHGVRLAALLPIAQESKKPAAEAIRQIRVFRRGRRLDISIEELIEEGRV